MYSNRMIFFFHFYFLFFKHVLKLANSLDVSADKLTCMSFNLKKKSKNPPSLSEVHHWPAVWCTEHTALPRVASRGVGIACFAPCAMFRCINKVL